MYKKLYYKNTKKRDGPPFGCMEPISDYFMDSLFRESNLFLLCHLY